ILNDVVSVDFKDDLKTVTTDDGETYTANAVIISTGSQVRKLGVPGEQEYSGRGVSYCATCDGFFFRGKPIVVIGGGDSAFEEALFLTRFGSSVTLIHRRDSFRASKIMIDRARKNEKIKFVLNSVVQSINGSNEDAQSVTVK
ncbi:thioredoxin-disulfide reductase, partial [Gardnerella vaginalis]